MFNREPGIAAAFMVPPHDSSQAATPWESMMLVGYGNSPQQPIEVARSSSRQAEAF
jgi:hypothetical protein